MIFPEEPGKEILQWLKNDNAANAEATCRPTLRQGFARNVS